jgi:hypothetical protein
MVQLDPSTESYVDPSGVMYVKVVKGLYGLQESAKLWYDTLSDKLVGMGFSRCAQDHACFYKLDPKTKLYLIVYVDDLFVCGTPESLRWFQQEITKSFKVNFTSISPGEFDYVGVHGVYDKERKEIVLTQPKQIEKVLFGVEGTSRLPYTDKLKEVDEQSPKLDEKGRFRFKSLTASLLYLLRTRRDISVPVSFLSTRSEPTEQDQDKLQLVLKYLNGTRNLGLRLQAGDLKIRGVSDASYGSLPDFKSNSGIAIILGSPNGPVIAKTIKQKTVANSSTVAELIAFSETLEEVMWLKHLLEELQIPQETIVIEQDNTSTMRLIEHGPSSTGRTKWMHIKHFWVKEHVENGDVRLEYVPSDQLMADGLTKPLGRKNFEKWRARILNLREVSRTSTDY